MYGRVGERVGGFVSEGVKGEGGVEGGFLNFEFRGG